MWALYTSSSWPCHLYLHSTNIYSIRMSNRTSSCKCTLWRRKTKSLPIFTLIFTLSSKPLEILQYRQPFQRYAKCLFFGFFNSACYTVQCTYVQYTVYLLTVHAIQYTVYLLRCYPAVYIQELSSKPKTVSLIRHTVYTHSYSEFRQNFSNSVAMLHFDYVCTVECNCTTVCGLCSVIVLVYVHFAV